ncbi:MAG: RNA polymerase sigma factor [Actinomycetota bacterium]|nr:RNA polymerase sigma factor [Actinomycetota bacterium]
MGPCSHCPPGDTLSDEPDGRGGGEGRPDDLSSSAVVDEPLDEGEVEPADGIGNLPGPTLVKGPMVPTEEADLVAAAKDGDRNAFDQLVRMTYAAAYTLALRLTANEEDASDVVQDAYLKAFRGLKHFRGDARFSTWMYRITANCASTLLSRRSRSSHDELSLDEPLADPRPEVDPEGMAEAGFVRDRMTAALAELPPRLRAVVVLRDIYDLPHEAIAAELGISQEAAKVRLHRARRKLRERLFPLPGEEHAHAV